jgi:transcriptional regulator GlxA family with amidase domain
LLGTRFIEKVNDLFPLNTVEDLAELVQMSVSSFRERFKSVTSMSPPHYQKVLRLQEARHLMFSTI